jgi:hypothetical protein
VCFVVHKTTSELERTILTTLYLVGAKNTDTSLLTFDCAYKCLDLVIKLEISKNRVIDHDIIKITLYTWFGVGEPTSSSNDDSNLIVSYWCVGIGDMYHISNADSSSNSEPNKGDLVGRSVGASQREPPF